MTKIMIRNRQELFDMAHGLTEFGVYPDVGNNLWYPMLGLVDEFGEWVGAPAMRKTEELCDVFWYYNQLAWELSMRGMFTWGNHLPEINVTPTALVVPAYRALSAMSGIIKKIERDGSDSYTAAKRRSMEEALYSFGFVTRLLDDVPAKIIYLHQKLGSRQERGKLKGDGDYR